jgi:membrane-bound lytic murein transglycosylase D
MSKIKFIAKQFAVGIILLYAFISPAFADVNDVENYNSISEIQLKERLEQISSDVELRYTSEVHSLINSFISRYRKDSEVLLGRSNIFFPIYENEFDKAGLPEELKFLSVVESSLRPTAVSHAGAVGLWQFIKSTGQIYGLTINSVVDERKDAMRSTQAAVAFLKDLYAEFGDWSLAMAAYNCGAGGVKKAQKVSNAGADDVFWDIKSYLPKETRKYVPKFIAVSYMMNYFHAHGLQPLIEGMLEEQYATAVVYDYTNFKELANTLNMDASLLWHLNPAFLKGYIPKSSKGYLLTLPESKMYDYLAISDNWDNLEYRPKQTDSERNNIFLYGNMKRRVLDLEIMDALPNVNTSMTELKSNDDNRQTPELPEQPSNKESGNLQVNASRYKYYKLQSQQSLLDVVDLFDVSLDELIKINEIDINNPPAPGTVIKIELMD